MSDILVPEYRADGMICLNVTPQQFLEINNGLSLLYKRREVSRENYRKRKVEEGKEIGSKGRKTTLVIMQPSDTINSGIGPSK